jgi:hypothetical protein
MEAISSVDFTDIENLQAVITMNTGMQVGVSGLNALELAMQIKPSVLESKRLRWPKFAWAVHNLVGHPLMQILAFFGAYSLAFRVHDGTVPKPVGRKK